MYALAIHRSSLHARLNMRNEISPSIFNFRQTARLERNQDFESDEAAFLDAFQNGEFHEEQGDFIEIVAALTDVQIASLYLPVCKALISGSGNHREGPTLKILMEGYFALDKWQRKNLKSIDDLFGPLTEVRKLLFEEMQTKRNSWWISVFYHFKMLECGVRRRVGLHGFDVAGEYDSLASELFDGR